MKDENGPKIKEMYLNEKWKLKGFNVLGINNFMEIHGLIFHFHQSNIAPLMIFMVSP
jgi:hypothetical protein